MMEHWARNRGMKALLFALGRFFLRHFFALVLWTFVGCVLWTVLYVGLFLWAVITNDGLGGILAYPAGLLVIVFGCLVVGGGIFVPACGMGALFCRMSGLGRWAAIPVVFGVSFLIFWLLVQVPIVPQDFNHEESLLDLFTVFAYVLSIPLGLYWWMAEGVPALLGWGFRKFSRYSAERKSPAVKS